jgi:RNA polymerase sigma-70 factor (ECF subfamily)
MAVDSASNATVDPAVQLARPKSCKAIEQALERLPARQREAFLLRYWEELDVAETAARWAVPREVSRRIAHGRCTRLPKR